MSQSAPSPQTTGEMKVDKSLCGLYSVRILHGLHDLRGFLQRENRDRSLHVVEFFPLVSKRMRDGEALLPPEALEPTSLAQQRKASRPVSLSAPKKLTFPDPVAVQPSAIAHIAAARCGFEEGEIAVMLMAQPGDGGHARF